MRLPISLKIFSITTALLALMVVVTWLSVLNFRQLNNQVRALADYYLPLQQQVASVEILIRQQIVHMERVMAGMEVAKPDPEFLANESNGFDMRGVNADQIVDSSLRMLGEAEAEKDLELDRVTLAVLGKQLPAIQTARQHFHMTFRQFQIEAQEGTPRSQKIVRETLLREKDTVDIEIGKTIDILNRLTQDTAIQAKEEEKRATTLNWIVTAIATTLGLIFAGFVTRSLVDPVKRLLGGTRAVEAGNLDVEILVRTHDELATLATSFNHMVVGLREKERIRATFGQYVDPRIVKSLLENRIPTDRGERQVMTVFFSDLQDFTRLCEGLTPDAAVRFLNRYFSLMSEVIRDPAGHRRQVHRRLGHGLLGPALHRSRRPRHPVLPCRPGTDGPHGGLPRLAARDVRRRPGPARGQRAHGHRQRRSDGGQHRLRNLARLHRHRRHRESRVKAGAGQQVLRHAHPRQRGERGIWRATAWPSAKSTVCASPASWKRCGCMNCWGWQRS